MGSEIRVDCTGKYLHWSIITIGMGSEVRVDCTGKYLHWSIITSGMGSEVRVGGCDVPMV